MLVVYEGSVETFQRVLEGAYLSPHVHKTFICLDQYVQKTFTYLNPRIHYTFTCLEQHAHKTFSHLDPRTLNIHMFGATCPQDILTFGSTYPLNIHMFGATCPQDILTFGSTYPLEIRMFGPGGEGRIRKKFIINKQGRKRRHVTQYYVREPYRHFRAIWWLFLQRSFEDGASLFLRRCSCAQTSIHAIIRKITMCKQTWPLKLLF